MSSSATTELVTPNEAAERVCQEVQATREVPEELVVIGVSRHHPRPDLQQLVLQCSESRQSVLSIKRLLIHQHTLPGSRARDHPASHPAS